jgi:methionyl-tRNA formyltransferase
MTGMQPHGTLRIVYLGTPDFSADFLTRLLNDDELPIEIVAVVTRADARVGRKQILTPAPVKTVADFHHIPTYHTSEELTQQQIEYDLGLVFAYGKILSAPTLASARYGFWNIHPSLLPAYRGPSPVAGPLLAGETLTGCTLMQMDEEMDHGPIIAQEQTYIFPEEQREELTGRLVKLGHKLFKQSIHALLQDGYVKTHEQQHDKATYTKLLQKDDGYVPFEEMSPLLNHQSSTNSLLSKNQWEGGDQLFNKWRAYYPWPGVWTTVSIGKMGKKRLKIIQMKLIDGLPQVGLVQLEGKNEVSFTQFLSAYGDQLSDPKERPNEKGK